jgi:hypothetical protein
MKTILKFISRKLNEMLAEESNVTYSLKVFNKYEQKLVDCEIEAQPGLKVQNVKFVGEEQPGWVKLREKGG